MQTEIVACALCQADGKDPDAQVDGCGSVRTRAWQAYEDEARRFIIAARALERWTETLGMFRGLAPHGEQTASA